MSRNKNIQVLEKHPNGIRKVKSRHFNTGACQCFKDCDCIYDRGWSEWSKPYFKLGKQQFDTYEKALKSIEIQRLQEEGLKEQKEIAKSWFESLTRKQFNQLFIPLKQDLKKERICIDIRRQNYDTMDDHYIHVIHRILLKRNKLNKST